MVHVIQISSVGGEFHFQDVEVFFERMSGSKSRSYDVVEFNLTQLNISLKIAVLLHKKVYYYFFDFTICYKTKLPES
jgi:hypothetical protein